VGTIENVEQLEVLKARYPLPGATAIADNGDITFWREDTEGNRLIVTMQAGQRIQYEEKPNQGSQGSGRPEGGE
jgi:hypothetical protein